MRFSGKQSIGALTEARRFFPLLILLNGLVGCAQYGPAATRSSHLAYNESVQSSEQNELLLNIVRLRYLETPEFLAINSISTQMRVEAQASVQGQFGHADGSSASVAAPGASVGYSESPTVTFTPRQDEGFTRQLVTPVSLYSLYLLEEYGWGLDRVLRIAVDDINGISNRVPRDSDTPSGSTQLQAFANIANTLRTLRNRHSIDIEVVDRWEPISEPLPTERVSSADLVNAASSGYRFSANDQAMMLILSKPVRQYELRISDAAMDSDDVRRFMQLTGLEINHDSYPLQSGATTVSTRQLALHLQMRSVLGTLAYLSWAVAVPKLHVDRGLVTTNDDVTAAMSTLFVVHCSKEAPESAWLALPYRGYWYYIDESDRNSRQTFGLLSSLIRLEISAGGVQNVPVLTLPVAR